MTNHVNKGKQKSSVRQSGNAFDSDRAKSEKMERHHQLRQQRENDQERKITMGKKQKNRGTVQGTSVNPQGLTPDEASRDPKTALENRAKKSNTKI